MKQVNPENIYLPQILDHQTGIIGPVSRKDILLPDIAPDARPASLVMAAHFLGSVLVENFELESTTISADAHGPFFYIQFETTHKDKINTFLFDSFFDAVEDAVNSINPDSADLYKIQCDRATKSIFAPDMDCFAEFLRPFSDVNGLELETDDGLSPKFNRVSEMETPHTIYTIGQIEGAVRAENAREGKTLNPERLPVFHIH
jgi:hypothetical protein